MLTAAHTRHKRAGASLRCAMARLCSIRTWFAATLVAVSLLTAGAIALYVVPTHRRPVPGPRAGCCARPDGAGRARRRGRTAARGRARGARTRIPRRTALALARRSGTAASSPRPRSRACRSGPCRMHHAQSRSRSRAAASFRPAKRPRHTSWRCPRARRQARRSRSSPTRLAPDSRRARAMRCVAASSSARCSQ